jgi:hypothetical protein
MLNRCLLALVFLLPATLDGATVSLWISPPAGPAFCLQADSTESVLALKQQVQNLKGIPTSQQQLFFGGIQLEDGVALSDYAIQNGSTLRLCWRYAEECGVDAAGGGAAMAGPYAAIDTVGQPAIGQASSAPCAFAAGFWNNVNDLPVAPSVTFTRGANMTLKIRIADVLAACSDPNGESLTLTGLGASAQGATITTTASHILYTPLNNNNDSFSYTVSDAGGGSITGTISIVVVTPGGLAAAITVTAGTVTVRFFGIPGFAYAVQRATDVNFTQNLTTLLSTNAPTLGSFYCTDPSPPSSTAYYRLMEQ